MAPNVYFGFLQYENFDAIIIGTEMAVHVEMTWRLTEERLAQKLISSKCLKNNVLHGDTVPLSTLYMGTTRMGTKVEFYSQDDELYWNRAKERRACSPSFHVMVFLRIA